MQNQNLSQNSNAITFLLKYLYPFRWQICLVVVAIIIVSSAVLSLGYALKYLIDQGFTHNNTASLNQTFAMLLGIVVILSLASYSRAIRVNWICAQIEAEIKKDSYKNIIKISPSYFEITKVSDVLSRLTTDLTLLSTTLVMMVSFSLRNVFMAIGGIFLLLFSSLKLTFYVLFIIPAVLVPLILIGRRIRKLSKENQFLTSKCSAHLEETLSAVKIVQAYNCEDFEINNFQNLIDQEKLMAKRRIRLRAFMFALIIGLVLSAISLILWIGGHDVLSGKMSTGALSSFVFYSVLVATSLGGISEIYGDLQRAIGALERVIEITEAQSIIREKLNPQDSLLNTESDLNIENISFCYPSRPEKIVLDGVSFKITNGKTTALVGPSGAGKSTVFQLLLRFYDPLTGLIKLGDLDIKTISLADLRNQFAFVPQDPVILSGSAYDNIRYGKVSATNKEIEAAAEAAEILDFFHSLPDGLNSFLGEKGVALSGGQKQRIAIARAILRNPPILLLDEATSSLDSENEQLVQKALANLRHNRTTLVISHRISTISNADLIIVLDKGKIVTQGTHEQLLKQNELYARLNQVYAD